MSNFFLWKPLTELDDNWVGAFVAISGHRDALVFKSLGDGEYETTDGEPCGKPSHLSYHLFAWLPEDFKTWGDLTND